MKRLKKYSLWHDRISIIRSERGGVGGATRRRRRRRVFLVELYRARLWFEMIVCLPTEEE